MKSRYKIVFLVMALAMTGILTNCSDDSDGNPIVSYIRVTKASASDSLLIAAGQGQMVAIIGQNLQNTTQVWFNDQRAVITPPFITSTSIIVRVPSQIPEVITDQLKLVSANGETLLYDFKVDISEPLVNRMKSEFVANGGIATFYGDYFYEPLEVKFAGGEVAEIVSVDDQTLSVIVPDGAQPGPVTITSNFGVHETNQFFRDDRNVIADFEGPFVNGWWRGSDFVVASDAVVPTISGKMIRMNKGPQGAWPYIEMYGGPSDGDVATLTKVIPAGAFSKPTAYSLKFEINTVSSIAGANMRIYLGSANGSQFGDARNNIYYVWEANLDTHGEWETVTIPWVDVYNANQQFPYNPNGYGMYLYFHGPNAAKYNFAMDNMRVVPNTND